MLYKQSLKTKLENIEMLGIRNAHCFEMGVRTSSFIPRSPLLHSSLIDDIDARLLSNADGEDRKASLQFYL